MTALPAPQDLSVDVSRTDGRTVVAVTGELDVMTAPRLREVLFDPETGLDPVVVVDLSAVTFLDSVGIGALVAGRRWLTGRETDMVLVCGDNQPRRVLQMVGLHKVFEIEEPGSPATALDAQA